MHLENNRTKDMSKKVACLGWLFVPGLPPENLKSAPPPPGIPRTLPSRVPRAILPPRNSLRLPLSFGNTANMQNTQASIQSITIPQSAHQAT